MKRTLIAEFEIQDDSNTTDAEISTRIRFDPPLECDEELGPRGACWLLAEKLLQLVGALQ